MSRSPAVTPFAAQSLEFSFLDLAFAMIPAAMTTTARNLLGARERTPRLHAAGLLFHRPSESMRPAGACAVHETD
jgi:hypothetical protein